MKKWIAAVKAKYRESMLAKIQQLRARHRELDAIAMDYRKRCWRDDYVQYKRKCNASH